LAHIRASDDPTVKTVASEDSAALVGIVIAAAGILGNQLTGDVLYQGIASLLIGLLLVYVAYALGRDSMGLLIGESADPALRQQLTDELSSYDEVGRRSPSTRRSPKHLPHGAVRRPTATSTSATHDQPRVSVAVWRRGGMVRTSTLFYPS